MKIIQICNGDLRRDLHKVQSKSLSHERTGSNILIVFKRITVEPIANCVYAISRIKSYND